MTTAPGPDRALSSSVSGHAAASPHVGRRVDARQEGRPRRAEVGDDGPGVLRARKQRLPAVQVLRPVEVAVRDGRQAALGRPAVQVVPVEELPAVDAVAELPPVARPAERQPRRERAAATGAYSRLARSACASSSARYPAWLAAVTPRAGASAGSHGSSLRLTWSVTQRTSKPLRPYRSTSSGTRQCAVAPPCVRVELAEQRLDLPAHRRAQCARLSTAWSDEW
jgi:hypothetical protein